MVGTSEFGSTEFVFEFGAGEFTPIDSHLIQLYVSDTARTLSVNDTSVTVFVDGV
jgi:hypothetical protein